LIPLLDTLQEYDAAYYVEGHASKVINQAEFNEDIAKMRRAAEIIEVTGSDEEKAFAMFKENTGEVPDEDTAYYLRALIIGLSKDTDRD